MVTAGGKCQGPFGRLFPKLRRRLSTAPWRPLRTLPDGELMSSVTVWLWSGTTPVPLDRPSRPKGLTRALLDTPCAWKPIPTWRPSTRPRRMRTSRRSQEKPCGKPSLMRSPTMGPKMLGSASIRSKKLFTPASKFTGKSKLSSLGLSAKPWPFGQRPGKGRELAAVAGPPKRFRSHPPRFSSKLHPRQRTRRRLTSGRTNLADGDAKCATAEGPELPLLFRL